MRAWGSLALRWDWRWSARACGESGGGDGGKSPTGTRVLVVIGISDQEMVGHTQLRNCQQVSLFVIDFKGPPWPIILD